MRHTAVPFQATVSMPPKPRVGHQAYRFESNPITHLAITKAETGTSCFPATRLPSDASTR